MLESIVMMNRFLIGFLAAFMGSISTGCFAELLCLKNADPVCVEPGGHRNIQGVRVYRNCWRSRVTYTCHESSDNNCDKFRQRGCEQVSADCRANFGNICLVQSAIFNCPVEVCKKTRELNFSGNIFCIDGFCAENVSQHSEDFSRATTSLAVAAAAAQDVADQDSSEAKIFAGKRMECSKSIGGSATRNCCKVTGLLKAPLGGCNEEEKTLGKLREEGVAVYVGDYCHNKTLGVCHEKHEVYCVYSGKLARIVQQQGKPQLGKNFGSPENPNCDGLTIAEFASIDFDVIDFREVHDEITKKAERGIPRNLNGLEAANKLNLRTTEQVRGTEKVSDRFNEFYNRIIRK
jgi:hypothetical protein